MPVQINQEPKDTPRKPQADDNKVTSRGEPETFARADQKNAQQGVAKDQPGEQVDMGDTPLEDDPKRQAELQAQAPEPNRGTPILRRNAYDGLVVDRI